MLSITLLSNTLPTLTSTKNTTFLSSSTIKTTSTKYPLKFSLNPLFSHTFTQKACIFVPKSSNSDSEEESASSAATKTEETDEWLSKLPDKKKALYAHSLPCIEAWLKSMGFYQSNEDRALWFAFKSDWHAHLSLDTTDLFVRYLKSGPVNLEKDVERRFSYALSREDIENAVFGGP